ncbi:MAG: hypothetical protein VB086_13720 [Clostridiaceae bacterium]|nr:hypothetical protein [Clostridiaceae bacterium]
METDGDGAVTAENVWGMRLLERKTAEADYGYRFDGHGDIIALTDEHGTVLEDYSYDPYGVDLWEETTHIRKWKSDSLTLDNPFRYCGEYYDPTTGRFMQEDMYWNTKNQICGDKPAPINGAQLSDIFAIRQSTELYIFVLNNPVRYMDKSGEAVYAQGVTIMEYLLRRLY